MSRGPRRRDIIQAVAAASAAALLLGRSNLAGAQPVTDYAGNSVDVGGNPHRLLLGDGHLLLALALVSPEPVKLIAAWQGDLVQHSTSIFEAYRKRSPQIADVPIVGQASAETFSVEAAIAAAPDLALLAGCYGPGKETPQIVEQLKAAGVPVLFVDFFIDPINNTAPSMRSIGKILGGEAVERAEAFAAFHETRLKRISDRLKGVKKRPNVLLDMHAGAWDCCWLPGTEGMGRFVDFAGGTNLGAPLSNKPWILASREYVLSQEVDAFVTTGGPYMRQTAGPVLGPGVSREEAVRTLKSAVDNSGLTTLPPLQEGRAAAFWHLFQATPMNIVAIETLARATHPDLFADIDPVATMAEINNRFFALPLEGCYSVAL